MAKEIEAMNTTAEVKDAVQVSEIPDYVDEPTETGVSGYADMYQDGYSDGKRTGTVNTLLILGGGGLAAYLVSKLVTKFKARKAAQEEIELVEDADFNETEPKEDPKHE